jgi:hypothetical protein
VKGCENNGVKINLVVVSVRWLRTKGVKYPLIKKKDRYLTFFTFMSPCCEETIAEG